ncbi:MAG: C4-type zinc ribbon domain-containing protein [Myxococcota bacterium]|nr:C4-type zinc ribbon domain-containing protein [Myxococcota bacterium]
MRETLITLHKLQQIDLQALELEKAAQKIPDQISNLEAEPDAIRVQLGELNNELEGLRLEQAEAETAIGDKSAETTKWKRRLNEIRTPREYQALSREVEQNERSVKNLEERVMELMVEIEEKEGILGDRTSNLREIEEKIAQDVLVLKQKQAELSAEAKVASAGRTESVNVLPEKFIKLYEKVRARRRGIAVVKIDNAGTCDGCQIQIRPQLMLEVRQLESVIQCPQCQRILVLEALVTPDEEE